MDHIMTLRKALARNKRVDDGTVVRFTKRFTEDGRGYNYVAVFVRATGLWYTTGKTHEMSTFIYDAMMAELANAESAEIVTSWETL